MRRRMLRMGTDPEDNSTERLEEDAEEDAGKAKEGVALKNPV